MGQRSRHKLVTSTVRHKLSKRKRLSSTDDGREKFEQAANHSRPNESALGTSVTGQGRRRFGSARMTGVDVWSWDRAFEFCVFGSELIDFCNSVLVYE